VTVTVTDVNDAPVVTDNTKRYVSEESKVGELVGLPIQ